MDQTVFFAQKVLVQASSAAIFVDSIGVNAHIDSGYPNWESSGIVEAEMAYLNVKNVRDGTPYDWALKIYIALARTGVHFDLTQENPIAASFTTIGSLQDTQRADLLELAVPGSVKSLEGANEYNISSYDLGTLNSNNNLGWGALDDKNLQAAIVADPILTAAGVLVVAASTSGPISIPVIGPYVSSSNWHVYGGVGQQLKDSMAAGVNAARASAPGKPVYVTETGISSSGYASSFWGTADDYTQGIIDTNAVLDGYNDGAAKTFIYDLMDDTNQSSTQQNQFGLFRVNGTPKPAATDIKNLVSILSDDGTTAMHLDPLSYSISGLPTKACSMLFEKSNGAFYIVVWNAGAVLFNGVSEVTPPISNVAITFKCIAQSIIVYNPIVGLMAQQFLTQADSISFELSAAPIIVEIVPEAPRVTLGTGVNTISLGISEDAYLGNAQFTISVDSTQVGGTQTATAAHATGQIQKFDVKTNLSSGNHTVSVQFLNDAYGGTATTDRNLYVVGATVDDRAVAGGNLMLLCSGRQSFAFQESAAVPVVISPVGPPAITTIGLGSDTFALNLSEDAYQGDAQFNISIDGMPIGGTQTVTASHAGGANQEFDLKGTFPPGKHSLSVNFLNDLYAGSSNADRNLYVTSGSVDGIAVSGASLSLMSSGVQSISFQGPAATMPAASGLVLHLAEDAYQGNAQFTVAVDGHQIGLAQAVTALNSTGGSQAFNFNDLLTTGAHDLAVTFTNDAYGGSSNMDRNLYVKGAEYGGTAILGANTTMYSNGTQHYFFAV